MPYIYCFTNRINGKQYVGKWSRSLGSLLSRHRKAVDVSHSVFHKAVRKYGFDTFDFEILFDGDVSLDVLNCLEVATIAEYRCLAPNGYNMVLGGSGGGVKGRKVSAETRAKLSKANTGKRHTEETKQKLRELAHIQFKSPDVRQEQGRKISIGLNKSDVKQKLSRIAKEAQNRPEVRAKKSATTKAKGSTLEEIHGVVKANEIRKKLSEIHKAIAKERPELYLQIGIKNSLIQKGRVFTEEHKQAIRTGMQKRKNKLASQGVKT